MRRPGFPSPSFSMGSIALPRFSADPDVAALTEALRKAGVTAEVLRERFGVTLWKIIPRGNYPPLIKIDTTHAKPDFSVMALQEFLYEVLQDVGFQSLAIDHCCGNQCRGCYAHHLEPDRSLWVG